MSVRRILIYRLGSMGDTIVALPCFHAIRRVYPDAHIALLSAKHGDTRAISAAGLLGGMGVVDDYIAYKVATRNARELASLRKKIRLLDADLLIYLAEPRRSLAVWRDFAFFKTCRIRKIVGVPFARSKQRHQALGSIWESEAARLARCLPPSIPVNVGNHQNWSLGLITDERRAADVLPEGVRLIGLAIGARLPAKDWGAANWRTVLRGLADDKIGLVLLGAADERNTSLAVADNWPGPVVDLCGQTAPRESAAVIQRLDMMLCHDGGPMHLAASVGTPCVAVFSGISRPGVWFPFGDKHQVLYPKTLFGSIDSIEPNDVLVAARSLIGA